MIRSTTNGGATWTQDASGTSNLLYGVACPSASACYAVGVAGMILHSTDGGATWAAQNSGTTNALYGVACPSASTCYAGGTYATMLVTTNGGATWTPQALHTAHYIYGLACPSTSVCYAVGGNGGILATSDGGATWTAQASGIASSLRAISCPSASACAAVGDNGVILTTSNGGGTWNVQSSGTTTGLAGVACTSASACDVVGGGGTILATTDGGATWTAQASGTTNSLRGIASSAGATSAALSGAAGSAMSYAVGDAGTVVVIGEPAVTPSPSPTNTAQPSATPTSTATNTAVPTDTATDTAVPTGNGATGTIMDYPRIANYNGFRKASQAETYSRYGLVVASLSAASGSPSGLQALKTLTPNVKALFYLDPPLIDVPGFNGFNIYPGWWLTLAGTTLAAPINATTTSIPVVNAAPINTYLGSNPDILVDGESMHVTAVNLSTNTLTVQRGYYSTASAHNAGVRVAAHATKWPNAWMVNLSSYCPRNPATGQTWDDYFASQVTQDMATGAWDGVYFDDFPSTWSQLSGGQIDANNDNVPDGSDGPSGTGWLDGTMHLLSLVRARNPQALIIGNGGYFAPYSAGREMEHFPYYNLGWNNGLNTYLQLAGPGGSGVDTMVNPDTGNTNVQNLQTMRFGLGTALLGNGYYTYDHGTQSHGQTWWYDEYDNGAGSSLASATDATQTTIRLAPGTGNKFAVGNIVRVALNNYSNESTSLDDEQMKVLAVNGDTLSVQRGYNGTNTGSHTAGTKVMTQAQLAAGLGWLGQPLSPAAQQPLSTPNQILNGDFSQLAGSTLSNWTLRAFAPAAATVSQDSTTGVGNSTSARVTVNQAAPGAAWDASLTQQAPSGQITLSLVAGQTYTLSFYAKSSTGQAIMTSVGQTVAPYASRGSQWFTLTNSWQKYTMTFTAKVTETALKVAFNVGQSVGTTWLDRVTFQQGDPNVWRRDFTHGTVLVNGTQSTQTVTVGSGYRHILGTQNPTLNNGGSASTVTIPAQDAVLLVKSQ